MPVVLNVINGSVYEHTARVSSYLATLDCLEFTFSEGGLKLANGTSFGCQNWFSWTDFCGRPIFALQAYQVPCNTVAS